MHELSFIFKENKNVLFAVYLVLVVPSVSICLTVDSLRHGLYKAAGYPIFQPENQTQNITFLLETNQFRTTNSIQYYILNSPWWNGAGTF